MFMRTPCSRTKPGDMDFWCFIVRKVKEMNMAEEVVTVC